MERTLVYRGDAVRLRSLVPPRLGRCALGAPAFCGFVHIRERQHTATGNVSVWVFTNKFY